eukprot:7737-Heterococcus_DN1.PRE.1
MQTPSKKRPASALGSASRQASLIASPLQRKRSTAHDGQVMERSHSLVRQSHDEDHLLCRDHAFMDPIHGHIMLEPVLIAIMNTPQFQRLGSLKQLGTSDYVFRGATHTRFSHSVGVAHLAGRMVETFMRSQRNLDITRTDYLCVKIAALAHDLGHGAFSHVWDNLFMRSYVAELHPDKQKWSHED